MAFAYKKLVVYQKAVLVVIQVAVLALRVSKVDPWLASQMRRAAASIALNIAEGAGEYSRAEKAKFYRYARRSAFELSAALDVVEHYVGIARSELKDLDALLDEIAAIMTTMIKNLGPIKQGARKGAAPARVALQPRPRLRPRPLSK